MATQSRAALGRTPQGSSSVARRAAARGRPRPPQARDTAGGLGRAKREVDIAGPPGSEALERPQALLFERECGPELRRVIFQVRSRGFSTNMANSRSTGCSSRSSNEISTRAISATRANIEIAVRLCPLGERSRPLRRVRASQDVPPNEAMRSSAPSWCCPPTFSARLHVRQSSSVDLPVRGQRHRLERHDRRGQHVLGQPRRQVLAKDLLRHALAVTPHHPGRGVFPCSFSRTSTTAWPTAVLEQHGLHLPGSIR